MIRDHLSHIEFSTTLTDVTAGYAADSFDTFDMPTTTAVPRTSRAG